MKKEIIIDENYIQTDAKSILNRKLTKDEYEEVFIIIFEELSTLIQNRIQDVIDQNKKLEQNKDADKTFPYYKVYWRNEVDDQINFKKIRVFKKEKDALEFVDQNTFTEFDQWKIILINQNNTEKEVYKSYQHKNNLS